MNKDDPLSKNPVGYNYANKDLPLQIVKCQ